MKNQSTRSNMDWIMVTIYIALVVLGWLNIYSSTIPETGETDLLDISQFYSKQLVNILLTIPLIIVVLSVDGKFYEKFTSILYVLGLLAVAGLFVLGKEVKGQTNWYAFGPFSLQPAEFTKIATSLALAKYLGDIQINLKDFNRQLQALALIFLPVMLIAPNDPGSALIFMTFFFVLHREGMPSWYLWAGFSAIVLFVLTLLIPQPLYIIGATALLLTLNYYRSKIVNRNIMMSALILVGVAVFTLSVNYVFNNVFEQHHRDRFNVLLGKEVDVKGIGYNVNQSKIAVGSGGLLGKGFMEGTQTKGGFVPEQHTDYAFTIVAEEWGFLGSLVVIALFMGLIARILYLAERQKTKFSRVYGYCVASILFIHFFVNVAMVLGIFPTIGVPLPFFSYGGSGLWAFTVLLFVFIKLDANKVNEW